MADPRLSQNAARLSEDIGDVLTAIRRLIAEDEALTAARDRLGAERAASPTAIDEDAGEFLARRYGGNAALARHMACGSDAGEGAVGYQKPARLAASVAQSEDPEACSADDTIWPLGSVANGPDAARPHGPGRISKDRVQPGVAPQIMRHDMDQDTEAHSHPQTPAARNELARTLSADMRRGGTEDTITMVPRLRPVLSSRQMDTATHAPPLRLDAGRRVVAESDQKDSSGWRAWLRPEAQPEREAEKSIAHASAKSDMGVMVQPSIEGDDDDFAEAFDWKARMRPDLIFAPVAAPSMVSAGTLEDETKEDCAAVSAHESDADDNAEIAGGFAAFVLPDALPIYEDDDDDQADDLSQTSDFDEVIAAMERADAAMSARGFENTAVSENVDLVASTAAVADEGSESSIGWGERETQVEVTTGLSDPVSYDTVTGLSPDEEEQSIRDLLREMIQEELHGELGERFSRNLRAVIRREVASAIDDQLDRL